jgi:hypothetical protein
MRARGRVSVCNEMKVAIDKVAGANEQTVSEVRGWLMETRPKMGEKNCTRAADERGRAGRALGGGDEETSSCAVGKLEAACAYERRAMQAGEQADRASQQMWCIREGHLVPPPSSAGRVCQAGACACARSRGAEESSRFHAVASSYTTYERRTTRENCARTGHCCRDTVVASLVIASHPPSACSGHDNPPGTTSSRIFAVVRMQSIITRDSSSTPCLG